jgi:hypothetical protein
MNRTWHAALGSCVAGLVLLAAPVSSHDDTLGARFVDPDGANASECLEHHEPCASIQYALSQARPGNTVKVSAGIYDVTGVEPESFLFGTIHAQGGYGPGGHFELRDTDIYPTILVGIDPARHRGRQPGAGAAGDGLPGGVLRPGPGRPVSLPQRRFPGAGLAQ